MQQALNAALPSVAGLELKNFEQEREDMSNAGLLESRNEHPR